MHRLNHHSPSGIRHTPARHRHCIPLQHHSRKKACKPVRTMNHHIQRGNPVFLGCRHHCSWLQRHGCIVGGICHCPVRDRRYHPSSRMHRLQPTACPYHHRQSQGHPHIRGRMPEQSLPHHRSNCCRYRCTMRKSASMTKPKCLCLFSSFPCSPYN